MVRTIPLIALRALVACYRENPLPLQSKFPEDDTFGVETFRSLIIFICLCIVIVLSLVELQVTSMGCSFLHSIFNLNPKRLHAYPYPTPPIPSLPINRTANREMFLPSPFSPVHFTNAIPHKILPLLYSSTRNE